MESAGAGAEAYAVASGGVGVLTDVSVDAKSTFDSAADHGTPNEEIEDHSNDDDSSGHAGGGSAAGDGWFAGDDAGGGSDGGSDGDDVADVAEAKQALPSALPYPVLDDDEGGAGDASHPPAAGAGPPLKFTNPRNDGSFVTAGPRIAGQRIISQQEYLSLSLYARMRHTGISETDYDQMVKHLNEVHNSEAPRLLFKATRARVDKWMRDDGVESFLVSQPTRADDDVLKYFADKSPELLTRSLPAAIAHLLTNPAINTPTDFFYELMKKENIPTEFGPDTKHGEAWHSPTCQRLAHAAVEQVLGRPDFVDFRMRAVDAGHDVIVVPVPLFWLLDKATLAMKGTATAHPVMLAVGNHSTAVRQQLAALTTVALVPKLELLSGERPDGTATDAPQAASHCRQRMFQDLYTAAIAEPMAALDHSPLITLLASDMSGLPDELRKPKTIAVLAPFFRNLSGDTPQVHDVLMLTQYNGVWAQTPSQASGGFANLTSPFVRRECGRILKLYDDLAAARAAGSASAEAIAEELRRLGFRSYPRQGGAKFLAALPKTATGGTAAYKSGPAALLSFATEPLHTVDLGLQKVFLSWVLSKAGNTEELRKCLVLTSGFRPGFGPVRRRWMDGMNQSLWTGQDVRNALFAIVGALRFDNKIIPDDDLRKRIFTALEILLRLSKALRGDSITELELQECEKMYIKFGEVLKQTDFVSFRAKGTDFVKYFNYKVLIDDVRRHGMPLGFATESLERKLGLWKFVYQNHTNKQTYDRQILRFLLEEDFIMTRLLPMLGAFAALAAGLAPPATVDTCSLRGRLPQSAPLPVGVSYDELSLALGNYARKQPSWCVYSEQRNEEQREPFVFKRDLVSLFKALRLIRPSRNMDCTVYAYKFHGFERRELVRTYEPDDDGNAFVNDDPQSAWLFSPLAFFVYNDERLTEHVGVFGAADADADAGADVEDDGGADGSDISSDDDDADPFIPSGRRIAKNVALVRIPLSRCFVLGRWVGTAPGAKTREAQLATQMRGLSHASNRLWGARIASRADTLDVIRPAQVEGKVWRRPFFYGHGTAGFPGDGATGAAVQKPRRDAASSVVADAGHGAGAGAGTGVGAGASSDSAGAQPAGILVSFKLI